MDEGMALRDPSTWNNEDQIFDINIQKNAHDRANITAPNPPSFPDYDQSKEFIKHFDKDIDY